MSVLIVGSFIIDCVARTNRAPLQGETVVGNSFNTYLGGKGANQAFACIRMGCETYLAGAVGNDNFGNQFIDAMKKEGFDTSYVLRKDNHPTGTSLVIVEESGQNRICMVPGANLVYTSTDIIENLEELIKKVDYVIAQFEMKYEIVSTLASLCEKHGKNFVLNPAPARSIDDDVLSRLYLITPNETELGIIINSEKPLITINDYVDGAQKLISKGVKNVIVTLGTNGSLLVNKNGINHVESYKVKAIDTVGAGDSYTGSLVAMLDSGKSIVEAMKIATAVAAVEVTKHGAIPAIPYKKEVEEFIKKSDKYNK